MTDPNEPQQPGQSQPGPTPNYGTPPPPPPGGQALPPPGGPQPPPGGPQPPPYGAQPGGPQQPGGVPPMPPGYPGQPQRRRRGRFAALGGVGGVILLIVVVLAFLGFRHSQNHQVKAAEDVVDEVVQADSMTDVSDDIAPSFKLGSCSKDQQAELQSASKYRITSSKKDGDDGAKVVVDLEGSDVNVEFHLVDQSGWKVDSLSCTG